MAFVDDLTPFPEIPSAWDAPCSIENASIDVNTQRHDYRKIVSELDAVGCMHLQVRSYSPVFTVSDLVDLARLCRGASIQTLQAVIPHDPTNSDDDYVSVVTSNRILIGLVVHSASQDRRIRVDYGAQRTSAKLVALEIEMTTKKLESDLDCGSTASRSSAGTTPTRIPGPTGEGDRGQPLRGRLTGSGVFSPSSSVSGHVARDAAEVPGRMQ